MQWLPGLHRHEYGLGQVRLEAIVLSAASARNTGLYWLPFALNPIGMVKTASDAVERLPSSTVLWAAGVNASPLGKILAERTGAELDRLGRVKVTPDLTVPGHPNLFVIGDLVHVMSPDNTPLPGLAAVARQQGRYIGKLIHRRLRGKEAKPFRYRDRGNLAVIGRHAAVAEVGALRFNGFIAWILWLFVHIYYLIGFDNKLLVMFQWGWNYLTRKRGAQLITGQAPLPRVDRRAGVAGGVYAFSHAATSGPHADGWGGEDAAGGQDTEPAE
jgi:Pyridine nucleotide-disulphide oxidoreductase